MARIAKVIEIIGSSENSWQQAADNALEDATKTIDNISGIEVGEMTADVQDGGVTAYRATLKVAFAVDRASE